MVTSPSTADSNESYLPLDVDQVATTSSLSCSSNHLVGVCQEEPDWLQKLEELRKTEQLLKMLVEVGLPAAHRALKQVNSYYRDAREMLVCYEAAVIDLTGKKAALERSLAKISKELGELTGESNGLNVLS